ncbi:MAG: hypothetical protein ACRC28_18450 [Clostridium sp.]|uniref:hypothetical protein n=1 Tax=Clostridium sp. TaxID=1506 RepID=UPI003F38A2B1
MNRTNSKIVIEKVRGHILDLLDDRGLQGVREEIESIKDGRRIVYDIQACKHWIEGGSLLIYNYDMTQFLKELDLFKCNNIEEPFDLYVYLCSRELCKMIEGV